MSGQMFKEISDKVQNEMQFMHMWAQIEQDDKDSILSIARNYVQECWRDAHIIYKEDGTGKPFQAAIGIGKTFYDSYNQLKRKQPAIQLITEWKPFDDVTRQHDTEALLWVDAYIFARDARARRGHTPPEWDFHTMLRIHLAEQELLKNPGIGTGPSRFTFQ